MDIPDREDSDSDGVFSPPHGKVGQSSTWSFLRNAESCPAPSKSLRRRSSSFVAVQSALFQLNCLEDFDLEMIGEGFFAKVYKATHHHTGEVAVLKMNKHPRNSKLMLYEIEILNKLCHANILRYRGCCVHDGQLHALTEFINGGTLQEVLKDKDLSLPWEERVKIAQDIAEGMKYLHSKGVFHRDLNSNNCLIQREDGGVRAIVADFGLAARFRKPSGDYHSEVVGTAYWMAPECLSWKPYCEQADVFSFGIILTELITRATADSDDLPRTNNFGVDSEELKRMCTDCPPHLLELVATCCEVDPSKRPSFVQVLDVLTLALDERCLDQGQQCSRTSLNLKDSGFDESLCVLKKDTFANCSSSSDSVSCSATNVPRVPPKMTLHSKESHKSHSFPGATLSQSHIPFV